MSSTTDVIEHGHAARIRVIDFETTGTQDDPAAEVIELGRIDYVLETATIESPWTALARPVVGVIPPEAKAVHHLTEAMLADHAACLITAAVVAAVSFFAGVWAACARLRG
jgi:DNA polymerase III epsilon subunit-like protein